MCAGDGLTVLHRLALLSREKDAGKDAMAYSYQVVLLLTKACLELRPDLTKKTKHGGKETCLHYACRLLPATPFTEPARGDPPVIVEEPDSCAMEFVRLLVSANPGLVASRDDHLNTPLLLASVQGSRVAVELMLENGAYVDAVNNKGNSPLHIACKMQYFPLLALLLERDAYRELWDDRVRARPLAPATHACCACRWLTGCARCVRRSSGVQGLCPLHIACQNNWVMGVRALAGAGADVNGRTEKHGLTPAMVAVQMGYWQSLKELIYAGANLRLLQVCRGCHAAR